MTLKILMTGGAGYIGSHVVKLLGKRKYCIKVIDNLSTEHKEAVLYGELHKVDLKDYKTIKGILETFQPDVVMHFAASIEVEESVKNLLKY